MPHYLIHVGPHKTGTTYLQLRFNAARHRLGQEGVAYPTEWSSTETDSSHRKLMIGLREARAVQLKSQFEVIEIGKPDYVLISGEGLNLLEPPAIELLKTLVGGNPVTIIFYCRRWSELLPSLWQEEVKHGSAGTFPEFLSNHATDPFASRVMNFATRLNIYANIFGRRALKLVSYSNLTDDNVDLAEHFFDCFLPRHRRLIDDLRCPDARPNQSFPAQDVELIRALNSIHVDTGMPAGAALRNWFSGNAKRFDLTGLHSALHNNSTTLRFSDASPNLQRLQDMLFSVYGEFMVQPVASRRLFSPRDADIVHVGQRYLADVASRRTLAGIYAAFRKETETTE